MALLIIFSIATLALIFVFTRKKKVLSAEPVVFAQLWRTILMQKVVFYQQLDASGKERFEEDIVRFLSQVRITGVDIEIDITDRLLVASSAVIPVFGFPEWDYTFLDEVLLYPGLFDREYEVDSKSGEYISGMVGSGSMEGKMILSKPSLHLGFDNAGDKKNVGIHEFVHLLDKEDGSIDGVPMAMNNKAYAIPWLNLTRKKIAGIIEGHNDGEDINPYGATNEQEFLAVTSEYFFERPHLLQKNHPELYTLLSKAFNQDMTKTLNPSPSSKVKLGRNSVCLCGSGKKYKDCCLK
jgi:MtfA peptidase